jgi:hypothetical protein
VVQIEGLRVASLLVKIVLQLSPFSEIATAAAAMNRRMFARIFWDIHQDRPARFAIQFVVEPLGVHERLTDPDDGRELDFAITVNIPGVRANRPAAGQSSGPLGGDDR